MICEAARYALGVFLAWTLVTSPAVAASYEVARDEFDATLSFEQQITTQVLLNAAGFSPVVPRAHLSPQAYRAMLAFENANGYAASGIVTQPKMRRLAFESAAYLRYVGFREMRFPGRSFAIWVPLGLGLVATQDEAGLHFRDSKGRLALDMISRERDTIQAAHDRQIAEERARSATIRDDDFSTGDRWFAISSTWPDGSDHYERFYQDGSRVTGFALEWRMAVENINGAGIAAIMAGSLRSAILDEPFVAPPRVATMQAPVP